jgi:hypothetical protein
VVRVIKLQLLLLLSYGIVKVLYTFDDQNKTNCLARLPNALPIPVVAVDDATQIGVIELKTCIQAIVTARYVMHIVHRPFADKTIALS